MIVKRNNMIVLPTVLGGESQKEWMAFKNPYKRGELQLKYIIKERKVLGDGSNVSHIGLRTISCGS
jgi:hypothetical protein